MTKITFLISVLIINSSLRAQMPPTPLLGVGENWTNLWSVSYDYQGDGSVRYIVQDPSDPTGFCATMMSQQDSNTAGGIQRYVYYSYSSDVGFSWTANVLDAPANYGFPDITLSNGIPTIAFHKSALLQCIVFQDLSFGAFGFQSVFGVPTNLNFLYPKISGTTNGNLVMVSASKNRQGYYTTYNGASWSSWQQLSVGANVPGSYTVAAGQSGAVAIFTIDYSGSNAITLYKSSNNGATFDNGTTIFNYFVDGNDTIYANVTGGFQAVYSSDGPHLVFAAYRYCDIPNPPHTSIFVKPRILHWSQATGVTSIAGKYNIPNLADTVTTSSMASLCQPSIGVTPSGRLKCSFTTFLRVNVQIVQDGSIVNAGEIYYSTSSTNGTTWIMSGNVTNTPFIEEKYSSQPAKSSSDSGRIFYLRDMLAGNWANVPEWGKAPVYGIFKRTFSFSDSSKQSNEQVSYLLRQNYPNPFNPKTIINYQLSRFNYVTLRVYDMNGRTVATLVNEKQNAGSYEIEFDGSNLVSGVYFYKLTADVYFDVKSMVFIK